MHWFLALFLAIPAFSFNGFKFIEDSLKHLPSKTLSLLAEDFGQLCEFAAFELLSLQFDPDNFFMVRNLKYGINRRLDTGELDIVIFSQKTQKAVHLFEVKCKKGEQEAYAEADKQLDRFRNEIKKCHRNPKQPLYIGNSEVRFTCAQFSHMQYDILMPNNCSNKPTKAKRFDLSLKQVHHLQEQLQARLAKAPNLADKK